MNAMTPRLRAIVEAVLPVARAIDVGCDHAQVGIWLAGHGIVRQMTVSDIHSGPIRRGMRAVSEAGLQEKITCVQCDGLSGIPPQDAVIIAGMGGELIAEILEKAPWTKENCHLILQPMTRCEELRRFLFENGYRIVKEKIVAEREKLYTVLTVLPGKTDGWNEADCYLADTTDALAGEYLTRVLRRLERTERGMRQADKLDEREILRLQKRIEDLRKRREACIKEKGCEKA